jgi:hypothetical protein
MIEAGLKIERKGRKWRIRIWCELGRSAEKAKPQRINRALAVAVAGLVILLAFSRSPTLGVTLLQLLSRLLGAS